MEDPNSTLLPYILETLSRTPELCDTFENLCKNVHEQLIQEQNGRYANVRLAIQRALNVGQSLGIITLNNETIRVPFNFRQNKNYRNLAHFTLNATPLAGGNTAELIGTTQQQQKQNQNQNQQNKSVTPQKKEPAPKQKTQKELEEEKQHAKYIKQLEMEDSEYSITSTPSDRETTRARTRSRSASQRRNRNRSYSRSKGSKGRKAARSRGRYARRR